MIENETVERFDAVIVEDQIIFAEGITPQEKIPEVKKIQPTREEKLSVRLFKRDLIDFVDSKVFGDERKFIEKLNTTKNKSEVLNKMQQLQNMFLELKQLIGK